MDATHLHRWDLASSHHTSDGMVAYYRCRCGQHRIAQLPFDSEPRLLRR